MGVEVAFADSIREGSEALDAKGKWHFRLRHHEQASTSGSLRRGSPAPTSGRPARPTIPTSSLLRDIASTAC